MALSLTPGALVKMCFNPSDPSEEEFQPVLQIIDLKLVQSSQNTTTERYRAVLSDGEFYEQGMLATQKNGLVHSGRLQKGSIVKLLQYVTNDVQRRKIIIIVDLEILMDICEMIGKPVPAPKEPPSQIPVNQTGNVQPAVGNTVGNAASVNVRPNVAVPSMDRSRVNSPVSGVYSNGSESVRYGASNVPPPSYPKPEPGVGVNRPTVVNGSYGQQNAGFRNPQQPLQNSNVRPPQTMYRQPAPYANRGPMGRNDAPLRIIPISALNPYQNMWTIKARVTAKGELRLYNNARGEGKVFSFDLLDSAAGEIRATCFNAVADKFYNIIEVGKVYLVSRGTLKAAQRNFNHLPNDQEITLDATSDVVPCPEDDISIPQQIYNFRSIGDIESIESNSIVDVIAVVTSISPTASIMRKNGTETQKRSLQLKDMSGRSVEFTIWGNFCNTEGQRLQNTCDSGAFPILAVKSARVNDFNGKSVGTIATSQLIVEPDFPEAATLREWFENEGKNVPSQSISKDSSFGKSDVRKTISQIKDEKLGTSEKPDWITVCANVAYIKVDNFCYTACPLMTGDRQCNKKVTNNGDGTWRCDKCDKSVEACDYRYLLQMQIQDHTGQTWVTAFQEGGEDILGISAKDLYFVKFEEQDEDKFAEIIRKVVLTRYIFKLKVKEEMYNDEQRVKSTLVKVEKINFASDARSILDMIDKLKSQTGLGSVETGQAAPPVYTPIKSYTNTGRDYGSANQVGQYGNQSDSSFTSSGAPNSYMSCTNCGVSGHSSAQCLNIRNQSGQSNGGAFTNRVSTGSDGASGNCYKCKQAGHWAKDCPNVTAAQTNQRSQFPSAGSGGASGECFKCHQTGHWARDCPGISAAAPSHGNSNAVQGRYGIAQNQQYGRY